tara:strand:+ start:12 stop:179 length:168 start_codon:yes stop_codon:yes gene_type:complete
MNLDQIIPAIALIAVLILVLPSFIETNLKRKTFFKNLGIWAIIVLLLMILLYLLF